MTSRTDTVRVFVAVGISAEAREQLIGAVERIRQEVPQGIQWAKPDGMHLTLKFLGNIPSTGVEPLLECLKPVASVASPFPLRLAGLGMFPNRRKPRVLWAGVDGDLDELSSLQQASEDAINALGYPPEQRPFRPHITLGRPRRSVSDAQLSRIGRGSVRHYPSVPGGLAGGIGGCDAERTAPLRRALHHPRLGAPQTPLPDEGGGHKSPLP